MEQNLAVLIDFENIAAGADKENLGRVDVAAIFGRLKMRGRIVVARSYADWGRFARFKQTLLEQGVTMVELTSHGKHDKNRADIALVVDAMELAFTREYVDTFVIISGDSDFTPLALRLKELNKRVMGVGTRSSTSKLLVQATDEFIFYDSIIKKKRAAASQARRGKPDRDKQERTEPESEALTRPQAFVLLGEAVEGVLAHTDGPVLASIVKSALTRREPSFSESDLGFSSFGRFLEAAQRKGVVSIQRDQRSGGYRVDAGSDAPREAPEPAPSNKPRRQDDEIPEQSPEAKHLRAMLAEEGLDPLSRSLRSHIVELTHAIYVDRKERRRRTNLHTLRSELVRQVKQSREPGLTANRARAVLRALREAGVFLHADGNPVRSEGAHFQLQHDEVELTLDAMDVAYLRALSTLGLDETPPTEALAELLLGDEGQDRRIEELLAWISFEADVPDDAEVGSADRSSHADEE